MIRVHPQHRVDLVKALGKVFLVDENLGARQVAAHADGRIDDLHQFVQLAHRRAVVLALAVYPHHAKQGVDIHRSALVLRDVGHLLIPGT